MNPDPHPPQQPFLRLDEICDQFEQAWQAGNVPDLAAALTQVVETNQPTLFGDLLSIELRYRLASGDQPEISNYELCFPQLAEIIREVFDRVQNADDTKVVQKEKPPFDSNRTTDVLGRRSPNLKSSDPKSEVQTNLVEIGTEFGDYELLEEIGRGGMGVVYRARQKSLDREVAVKMILSGALADEEAVERFYIEAQAVGNLRHPNIVRVHEVGQHQGRHFFSMDYIEGHSLAEVARHHSIGSREAADYVRTIAKAIHYAHVAGIIHRDLKPSNILTDVAARPLITDFGMAKRIDDDSGITRTGKIMGTPSYMSPEQIDSNKETIGPLSDVYSLGAILYELLTGRPPFRGETALATLRQVLDQEPASPRILSPKLDRDLETITLKCLQKNPAKRYASASELAEELSRYWNGEPIQARPVTWLERSWRWCKRRPAAAGLMGVSIAAVLTIIAGSFWYNGKLQQSLDDTRTERNKAKHQESIAISERKRAVESEAAAKLSEKRAIGRAYSSDMLLAQRAWNDGNLGQLQQLLELHASNREFIGFEWHYWNRINQSHLKTFNGHLASVDCVSFSPQGKRIASASADKTIKVWNSKSGQEIVTLKGHTAPVNSVAFSPDGMRIASASMDGTVKIWDAASGDLTKSLRGHKASVRSAAFSPDGERIASASIDKTVKVWDALSGKEIFELKGHSGPVFSVSFSPDGKQIASAGGSVPPTGDDYSIRIWDASTGQLICAIGGKRPLFSFGTESKGHIKSVYCVSFSPDGKWLASSSVDRTIRIWDLESRAQLLRLEAHTGVRSISFSPDGKRLASSGWDGAVRVWETSTGRELFIRKGHAGNVDCVAFSPDGKWIASGSVDKTVKTWNTENDHIAMPLIGHEDWVWAISCSPNGKQIASASSDKTVQIWDSISGERLLTLKGHSRIVYSVAFSTDGNQIATGSHDNTVKIWDATTGRVLRTLDGKRSLLELGTKSNGHTNSVFCVAFSADGKRVASGSRDHSIKIWDTATGKVMRTFKGHRGFVFSVAFSPDGKRVASGSGDNTLRIWDVESGKEIRTLSGHHSTVRSVTFSPDGERIASGSFDNTLRIWDAISGENIRLLTGHTGQVFKVLYSPGGERIASTSSDQTVRLWDASNGREMLTLKGHKGTVHGLSFLPSGQRIASGGQDNMVVVWDARPINAEHEK